MKAAKRVGTSNQPGKKRSGRLVHADIAAQLKKRLSGISYGVVEMSALSKVDSSSSSEAAYVIQAEQ